MSLGPVMIDLEGTVLSDDDKKILAHPLVGGVIYFSRNYESTEQIIALSRDIRHHRPDILIAVDQEGGRVQRFKSGFTRLPAMQRFLPLFRKNASAALSLVEDCGWLMAVELLAVGVDISFAPVLDVDDNHCSVIADRSFSPQPEEVTQLAGAWIRGMRDAGMATTGKHFPGHGGVTADSHLVSPVDKRDWEQLSQHDMIPFKALLPQLQAVMPAHVIFSSIDSQPVGFSSHWLQKVLRQQFGFEGVIFSDDLTMEGAAVAGSYGNRALSALEAGCDMVLVCNHRHGAWDVIDSLEQHGLSESVKPRVHTMRAKSLWDMSTLQANDRYRKTVSILTAMTSTPL